MGFQQKKKTRGDEVSRAFCLAEDLYEKVEATEDEPPLAEAAPRSKKGALDTRKKAIRSAMNMLEYATCSRARLREKLQRKGYGREDVEAALSYVIEQGLLHEARDAAHAVEYLANARLYGKRKIVESLLAKGYRREHLEAADWDELDFVEICTRYLARNQKADREKTIACALRRGFAMREVLAALKQIEEEA